MIGAFPATPDARDGGVGWIDNIRCGSDPGVWSGVTLQLGDGHLEGHAGIHARPLFVGCQGGVLQGYRGQAEQGNREDGENHQHCDRDHQAEAFGMLQLRANSSFWDGGNDHWGFMGALIVLYGICNYRREQAEELDPGVFLTIAQRLPQKAPSPNIGIFVNKNKERRAGDGSNSAGFRRFLDGGKG
ncbi:MAG: hypothetical protein R3242_01095 [Akkermansiaceae bacterium]|nr:hypothetical protein [Akkermansiaceae bacterium]